MALTRLNPTGVNASATFNFAELATTGNLQITHDLTVGGNLTISGTTTTVNSTVVKINDNNIVLANNATTAAQANGAGFTINGANASMTYNSAANNFTFSHPLDGITVSTLTSTGLLTANVAVKTANIQDTSGTVTIQTKYNSQPGDVGVVGNLVVGTGGTGNVSATYFIGDGSQLTGVAGSYANANVALYLPTYTGNLTAGNITTSGTLTANGWTTLQESSDTISTPKTGATGVVAHDISTGAVFYHSSIAANFTVNFTNVATTDNRTTVATLILAQGGTGYYASACQIDGVAQTIKWPSATAPTPTASRTEFQNFVLIRVGSAWTVTSSLASFG